MELTTEKAESESAISIGWVRPHPQFYPRYSNTKNIYIYTNPDENQNHYLQFYREKLQKMKNELEGGKDSKEKGGGRGGDTVVRKRLKENETWSSG